MRGGRLSIELCGCLADPYGREVMLDVAADSLSVTALLAALVAAYPALGDAMQGRAVRACVNETLVSDKSLVRLGDEIALFPPVSGG